MRNRRLHCSRGLRSDLVSCRPWSISLLQWIRVIPMSSFLKSMPVAWCTQIKGRMDKKTSEWHTSETPEAYDRRGRVRVYKFLFKLEQKTQSNCNFFRQGGLEMIDGTYNSFLQKKLCQREKKLSMEILMEKFNPFQGIKSDTLQGRNHVVVWKR